MTVDVAPRTRRRAPRTTAASNPDVASPASRVAEPAYAPEPSYLSAGSYAIGEIDQTVFDCPSCSRPLALGARRCPGCRTRLINGVQLGKASTFIVAGLVVGLLAGGGSGVLFGIAGAAAAPAVVVAGPSAAPSTAATATATPAPSATSGSTATPAPAIPAVTRSALVQVVGTNGRLASAAGGLRAALAAKAFDASEVAHLLRAISADTVFGQQLADRLTAWPDSVAAGAQLRSFYGSLHDLAADSLVASVRNAAAYRASATGMVGLLDGMAAIEEAVRATASAAGVDLPAAPTAP